MNPKLLNSIEAILLIFWILEAILRCIVFPFYYKSLDNFYTVNWYHKLEHKYRRCKGKTNWSQYYNYLLFICLIFLTSCQYDQAKRAYRNTSSLNSSICVQTIDSCEYLIFSPTYGMHKANCTNPIHSSLPVNNRAYQIDIVDSLFKIYDGNRLVGSIYSTELNKLITKDNE